MLFARSPALTVIAAGAAMLLLGYLGDSVYRRMSEAAAMGARVAGAMGIGCAIAVGLQYAVQIRWQITPLLAGLMLAALLLLAVLLRSFPGQDASVTRMEEAGVPPRRIAFTA